MLLGERDDNGGGRCGALDGFVASLPPDAALDVASVAARIGNNGCGGDRGVLPPDLDRAAFCDLMAEAVARSPRPRAYLGRPKTTKAGSAGG